MKKILALIISVCFCFGLFACSSNGESGNGSSGGGTGDSGDIVLPEIITNKTYNSFWMKQFDYKTMPIAAFNAAPPKMEAYGQSMITDEHYKKIAEAGINTVYGLYERAESNVDEIRTALSLCEKYGLSYVAVGNGMGSFNDVGVAEASLYKSLLKDSPSALGGVIVRDEPNEKQFSKMSVSKSVLRQLFGKKYLYHSNLYPNYATTSVLYGGDDYPSDYSYENYVKNFCETFAPQILSYDYYPLQKSRILDGYFVNMSVIRKYAEKYEIPFWVYIQCCSFNKNIRIPNEGELKWLVNTSLAYGCKGLQYFTFVDAVSSANEQFTGSPIDKDGNKTAAYDYIAEINGFVAEIDEVLMCSISKGCMLAGKTPCEIPEKDIISSFGALNAVNGESVLVGCFDYKGKNAYYVVNNSLTDNSVAELTFGDRVTAKCYSSTANEVKTGDFISFDLSAGEAVLVVLE